MNWSVDFACWAADPRATGHSDRLQAFFEGQGLWTYANECHLDGRPLDRERSLGLASMNAVASLAATQARSWRFVDELWSVRCPRGTWRYYDGMLYLLAMLHVRGQFRPYMEARRGLSASFTSSSTSQPSLPHTRKRLATTSRWSSSLVHGLS